MKLKIKSFTKIKNIKQDASLPEPFLYKPMDESRSGSKQLIRIQTNSDHITAEYSAAPRRQKNIKGGMNPVVVEIYRVVVNRTEVCRVEVNRVEVYTV